LLLDSLPVHRRERPYLGHLIGHHSPGCPHPTRLVPPR
jgi:hypothetical protein